MSGLNAQTIINTCKAYTVKKIEEARSKEGVVRRIEGSSIYVQFAWAPTTCSIPIKKLKHVTVGIGDTVLLRPYKGSYMIEGVIE